MADNIQPQSNWAESLRRMLQGIAAGASGRWELHPAFMDEKKKKYEMEMEAFKEQQKINKARLTLMEDELKKGERSLSELFTSPEMALKGGFYETEGGEEPTPFKWGQPTGQQVFDPQRAMQEGKVSDLPAIKSAMDIFGPKKEEEPKLHFGQKGEIIKHKGGKFEVARPEKEEGRKVKTTNQFEDSDGKLWRTTIYEDGTAETVPVTPTEVTGQPTTSSSGITERDISFPWGKGQLKAPKKEEKEGAIPAELRQFEIETGTNLMLRGTPGYQEKINKWRMAKQKPTEAEKDPDANKFTKALEDAKKTESQPLFMEKLSEAEQQRGEARLRAKAKSNYITRGGDPKKFETFWVKDAYGATQLDAEDIQKLKEFETPDAAMSHIERAYRANIISQEIRNQAINIISKNIKNWNKWRTEK